MQSKSHLGMENVTDLAGLLETHDVLHSKQESVSAASLFLDHFHCTPIPKPDADVTYKVSFSIRNRNQVTIIELQVPVITRDKAYTYPDGFISRTIQMPNS